MGDRHHGARIVVQELLEPVDGFGIQMVGRFVQQQHVRLGQQQAAQRHAALLAAGQRADLGIPRRQAQRVGGHFQLALQRMRIVRGEQVFELLLFDGELVEISAFLGIGGVDLIQSLLRIEDLGHAFFDRFTHGLLRIQLRLLCEIADLGARIGARLTLEIGVHAGHDLQNGGFARAVDAEQADLRAREEAERDVLDDLAFRGDDLADPVHGVDVLHAGSQSIGSLRAAGSAARQGKGVGKKEDP